MYRGILFSIIIVYLTTIIATNDSEDFPMNGTLHSISNTNGFNDAKELRASMEGFGTQESRIVNLLTLRTYSQRKDINEKYEIIFSRDLTADLKSETGGHLNPLLVNLLIDPLSFLAIELHDAMAGWGTDEETITEILCTHTSEENKKIADFYQQKYKKTLSSALDGEITGNYNKLMQSLITVQRTDAGNIKDLSKALVPKIAKKSIFRKSKSNEQQRFIDILSKVTFHQMRLILGDFYEIGRKTLRDTITTETSGDFRTALITLVDVAENRPRYYAKRLYEAMEKLGTNDKTLIRIIVTRVEVDMKNIKEEFKKSYKITLESMITDETSGVYRRALLLLIDGIPK